VSLWFGQLVLLEDENRLPSSPTMAQPSQELHTAVIKDERSKKPHNHSSPMLSADLISTATKQRILSALKIVLEIGKESAHVFPPLKSCLAVIEVLVKHYDVRFHRTIT